MKLRIALLSLFALFAATAAEPGTRTIRLVQDDAQLRMVSKLYELRYVKATDIRPYVEAAVRRYSSQSLVERVNYAAKQKNYILVSTGEDFLPYIDDLIAKIDQPGVTDEFGSVIDGTGITRIAYRPNYRAAEDIVRIINDVLRSPAGYAYLNAESNLIYWKDDRVAALGILAWVKYLDRPLPQVNLRVNYYEIRESKLRDIGVDYLAWKNGPGLNLFEAGYSAGNIFSNEAILQLIGGATKFADIAKDFSTGWGYGGFMTAPQFDLSFVRILQQSGNAKLAATTNLTFINTPIYDLPALNQTRTYQAYLTPDYQNISKNADDRTSVEVGGGSNLLLQITDPVVCFGAEAGEIDTLGQIPANADFYRKNHGNLLFNYHIRQKSVVERSNRGDEVGNSSILSGDLTLGLGLEKLLVSYEKETEVEQTIGIPFLSDIPYLKYLFGVTTTMRERIYIVVTAEAALVHPDLTPPAPVSREVLEQEFN